MQKAAHTIGATLLALALIGFWLYGCGSEDILDQNNQRYLTDVTFSDGETDDTLDVDVVQDTDCDDNASTTGPVEDFYNLFATIEIEVPEDTPGLTLDNYEISFTPQTSVNLAGNTYTPEPFPTVYSGSDDLVIPTNSIGELYITCMAKDGKIYIGDQNQIPDIALVARYKVTIKLSFTDEYDISREITISCTLNFLDVDNC